MGKCTRNAAKPFIFGIFLFFKEAQHRGAAPVEHPEVPVWSGTETPAAPAGWHTSRCRSRRGKACPCKESGSKCHPGGVATPASSTRAGRTGGGHLLVGRSLMTAELPAAVRGVDHLPRVPVRPRWAVGTKRGSSVTSGPIPSSIFSEELPAPRTPPAPYVPTMPTTT